MTRKSKGALYLQGRTSVSMGATDPRARRSAQARGTSDLTGRFVSFDEQGRVTIDYDALRRQLESDLNVSSDAAVTAAQLAGAYLVVSQSGALDVDYAELVADLGLRAMAFKDDAPQDGTPYERQDGEWVPASSGGGGLSDGDYGDITVSGGGSTFTIDNDVVTFAKMQNLSAERLVGAEVAGDPVELSTQFPLSIKGAALQTRAVDVVEVNLGSTPVFAGRFTITHPDITVGRFVQCWQAPGPYTGKGARADEAEMQPVQVVAVAPASGSATVYWQTPTSFTTEVVVSGGGRDAPATTSDPRFPNVATIQRRKGLVRGNVKFLYQVLG